jgi:nucleotide-binding universal stress UspA family protein
MSSFQRILVPVDFSPFSQHALRYGCALARKDGAILQLLHVVQDLAPLSVGGAGGLVAPAAAQYIDEIHASARAALEQIPSSAWGSGVKTIERRVEIGTPRDGILEFAKTQGTDLICIGTHGRSGLARLFLGSVAEKIVQYAPCKVLVVRRHEKEFVDETHPEPSLKRVLVPTDFSDGSREAIRTGAEFASRFGAELHLLHVVEDSSPSVSEIALAYPVFQSYVRDLVKSGDEQLQKVALPGAATPPAIHRKVLVGDPVGKINDYADEQSIDLIVMGTHGRTGPAHWLIGSVAERIVRSAPCPVLVTPSGREST